MMIRAETPDDADRWRGVWLVRPRPGIRPAGLSTQGVGAALVEEGLRRLIGPGARGCVVLGDPPYYRRFGFTSEPGLRYGSFPSEYFQSLVLSGEPVRGEVTYHAGFDAG